MSDNCPPENQIRARRACRFCSGRKIRCTKEIPECSSCKLHRRKCLYNPDPSDSTRSNDAANLPPSEDIREQRALQSREDSNRAAVLFLDYDLFLRSQARVFPTIQASNPIPSYVKALIGESAASQQIAARYYQLAHPWLPIISRRKVFGQLLNPLMPPRVDVAFLLLCMKLITQPQEDQSLWASEYYAAVRFRMDTHHAGIVSLEILQGCILLAVYEHAHAIYPAAYTSIGICLQYAKALGMGWMVSADESSTAGLQIDMEEQKRAWWAIFLLERVSGLGNPQQRLLVPEPALTAQLPCTETVWENRTSVTTAATLSSPPESLGRFASTVQASYILSRVLGHVSDMSMDPEFQRQEVDQLDKTLNALILYSDSETGAHYSLLCYQRAISFCAIMVLYGPHLQHGKTSPLYQHARDASDNAARIALQTADNYLGECDTDFKYGDVPPFMLPWIYNAGMWFIHNGAADELKVIETALRKLKTKWRAAGTYLELLAARRVIGCL